MEPLRDKEHNAVRSGMEVAVEPERANRLEVGVVPEAYTCDYSLFFPFWSALTPGQQTRLANYCKPRKFRAGDNIYFHEICNGGMYYVYEGAIRIYMISPSGREATIYHRYQGQTGIILEMYENKPENIIPVFQAEEDSVLAYISKADLCTATQETPMIQSMYMKVTADCVQEVVNEFYGFAFLPLKARVARILLAQLQSGPAGSRFAEVTHEKLANATGTSREVATRTLNRMQEEGILRTGRRRVEILDLQKLKAIASL